MTAASRPEVTAAVASFWSRSVPPEALDFAKTVVAAAAPPSAPRARNLLFAASRLGAFGLAHGLELAPEVLLQPAVVERLCQVGLSSVSPATLTTLRTNLRYLAGKLFVAPAAPARLGRPRAKAPYCEAEIAAYLALAEAQPTPARRHRAVALICLSAGAGLMGGDLGAVRGSDVVERLGALVVEVRGSRRRVVPVRAEFASGLASAARVAGERLIIGRGHPRGRNVTSALVAALAGGADLAPLDVGRLRSTWLMRCAEDLGLRAFLDAAGVRCSQRLGDIVAGLEPVGLERAVALLGGRR